MLRLVSSDLRSSLGSEEPRKTFAEGPIKIGAMIIGPAALFVGISTAQANLKQGKGIVTAFTVVGGAWLTYYGYRETIAKLLNRQKG